MQTTSPQRAKSFVSYPVIISCACSLNRGDLRLACDESGKSVKREDCRSVTRSDSSSSDAAMREGVPFREGTSLLTSMDGLEEASLLLSIEGLAGIGGGCSSLC